ncbi:MAG: prepilin-type N-terminal cleavage/methylation domain-containing protein [Fimbriimonadaceae bacterium]
MKRGVTLVELLVVLAIIGVLAVVGFFGVRAAITHSHNSSDAASLRQIYAAAQLYGVDWDGQLRPIQHEMGPGGNKLAESYAKQIKDGLSSYISDQSIWHSRLDWRRSLSEFDPRRKGILGDHAEASYTTTLAHWDLPVNSGDRIRERLSEILVLDGFDSPSSVVFLSDIMHRVVGEVPITQPGAPVESIRGPRLLRLMYDGSVQLVPWERFWESNGGQYQNRTDSL